MAKRTQDIVGTYSDLPFNMKLDATGDIPVTSVQDSIRQSMFNILHTRRGSRPLNPDFGCMIESYLFEPFDQGTGKTIGDDISNSLSRWEPRININSVNVNMFLDNQEYQIEVSYTILNLQMRDSITFTLQKI
jgi:phage baseplate assembly protein W